MPGINPPTRMGDAGPLAATAVPPPDGVQVAVNCVTGEAPAKLAWNWTRIALGLDSPYTWSGANGGTVAVEGRKIAETVPVEPAKMMVHCA